jgi:uncharacterized protein YaiE (UPF0345 family)
VGVAVVEQEVELGRTIAVEKEEDGRMGVGVMVEAGYSEDAETEEATELLDGRASEFPGVETG